MADIKVKELSRKLFTIRKTGNRGTPILMHRALRSMPFTVTSLLSIILLPILFDILLWENLDVIMNLWTQIFDFWSQKLDPDGQFSYTDIELFGRNFSVIYPDLPIHGISFELAVINVVVCLIIFLVSFIIPSRFMPFVTLLRASLLIQFATSVYCFISHYVFPYDTAGYLGGMLSLGAYLLFIISPVLAFIYYIFSFSVLKKILVTIGILGYFIVLIPCLYILHALIISTCGLIVMPLLYLMFGPLLVTLMFVSLYSCAMTGKVIVNN